MGWLESQPDEAGCREYRLCLVHERVFSASINRTAGNRSITKKTGRNASRGGKRQAGLKLVLRPGSKGLVKGTNPDIYPFVALKLLRAWATGGTGG